MFVFPQHRDTPAGDPSRVLLLLIGLNVFIYLLSLLAPSEESLYRQFGFVPAHPFSIGLLTSMFVHAGFFHLIGNMCFLWMFAVQVEHTLGSKLFLLAYLVSGLGAEILYAFFTPASQIPLVGASGAISGVAGMYVILFPKSNFLLHIFLGRYRLKTLATFAWIAVGVWFAEQFLLAVLTTGEVVGTAFWGHVGGFAMGLGIGSCFAVYFPPAARRIMPVFPESPDPEADVFDRNDHFTKLKL